MEKVEIVSEYRLFVMSDGSIVTELVNRNNLNVGDIVKGCSVKYCQILSLLFFIEKSVTETTKVGGVVNYDTLYLEGISEIAKVFNVSKQSIRDKTERQLSQNSNSFKQLLKDYYSGNNTNLKTVLINSVSNKNKVTQVQDIRAINEYFSKKWF